MAGVTRGEINLYYLLKFKSIGAGQVKYLLRIPEFRKRMTDATLSKKHVDERILIDVLTQLHDDAKNGVIDATDIPLPKIRNMIRRLERSLSDSADS